MNRELADTLGRLRRHHGTKFSEAGLVDRFRPYFRGPRIEVRRTYPSGEVWIRRGRVGISCGWVPCFLLMATTRSLGSGDTLGPDDEISRVFPERTRKGGRGDR